MPLGKFFSDTPLEDNEIDQGVTSRRSQTEKARNALATSRVSRRWARTVQKEIGIHHESSKSSEETKGAQALQKQFFTGRLHHTHALSHSYESITCPDQNKANQRGRARCTWSLLRAIAQAFEAVFASPQAPPVKFVINTVVPDDTNTRMKGPNQGDRSLVHTVMNVVQSCAVYCDGLLKQGANKNHDWQCFSIPCPLSVLKTANTDHIHAAYRSTLVACASGLGERWKAFSLKPEVSRAVANAKWAAQVMCGDALEANSSAFRCERTLLAHNRQRSVKVCNTVAIRFKCCNHQLGLVRKPVVLGIERYWSTLVRLAHLMECAGFRRVEVAKYPKEMDAWKKRAAWLMQGFDSRSKRTTDSLKNLLGFLNGDTSQRTGPLVRWCLLPANNDGKTCCQDDSDSWNRLVSMLSSFLCKAYAVPLLHRMKHYAPAASYVKVSTNLHGILPRILEEMENVSATSANRSVLSEVVDVLLAENGGVQTLPDVLNNEDFQTLLGDMLNENKDYAAQNGARRRLVLAELLKDTFHESSIITDMLVSPMERGTNLFLRRTHLLYEMQYLSNADPKYQEHQRESMDKFLQVIRGDLGRELLGTFLGLLTSSLKDAISNGLTGGQSQLNLIFQMVICCVTDFYRRFVQEFMQPPYTLLALANADAQTFVSEWKRIHQKRAKCRFCVDIEFTAALLDAYPEDIDSFPADIEEVQELLQRIAVWSPITSDSDKKHSRSRSALETPTAREARLHEAAHRKVRRLSGWNVFCKERMGGESLDTGGYKSRLKECSAEWRNMAKPEREAFEVEATRQEQLRAELAATPLSVPEPGKPKELTSLEAEVGKNGCKHFSARRLLLNIADYEQHSMWTLPTCSGALKASLINVQSGDDDIAQKLEQSLHAPLVAIPLESQIAGEADSLDIEVHDTPCPHFVCVHDPNSTRMDQMVKAFSWKLEEHAICAGTMLVFSLAQEFDATAATYPRILGVSVKKPKCHVFMKVAVEHDQVTLAASSDSMPEFESSHELFLHLLRLSDTSPDVDVNVEVQVWERNAFLVPEGSKYLLKSNPETLKCTFTVSSAKRNKTKPAQVKLPFSLDKLLKKKRNTNKKPGPKAKPKPGVKKHTLKKSENKDVDVDSKHSKAKSFDNDSNNSDSSDSDNNSSSSESSHCNGDDDPWDAELQNADAVEKEEEVVVPMSSTVAAEEKQVAPLAQECKQADQARSEAAEALRGQLANQKASASGSSFFSKELGLADASIAVSGRSVCVHCRLKIALHCPRFSLFHSKVRPSTWCHAHCLYGLTMASGLKSVPRLREIIAAHTERHVHSKIVTEAQAVLTALESVKKTETIDDIDSFVELEAPIDFMLYGKLGAEPIGLALVDNYHLQVIDLETLGFFCISL
ncbi:unnamed protein product [Durusdinium trenchii]|uniref:Uncharacterized protein n=1 Tax=Durusdinium trenchii TaxID=1381693 RepID=A0ABP0MCH2_9DINO